MKANQVLKLLNISRCTLHNYVKLNKIKYTLLDNGLYDYDEESVYNLMKKDYRINVIYARVTDYKQTQELQDQIELITKYCNGNKINIERVYQDIHSGGDLNRPNFNKLIDEVMDNKIKNIYISNKDRLSKLSFKTLNKIFEKFDVKIIHINDDISISNDNEIINELVNIIDIYSYGIKTKVIADKIDTLRKTIEKF